MQRVLSQLALAVGSYADPEWADSEGWPTVAGGLHRLILAAPPGGDLQLAGVNALSGARLGPDELTALAGWLDGDAPLDGLTVDTDLSWTMLGALVAHGWRGEDDIAAAAAADATASGDRRAALVRALIPTPESKQAVFDRLIHDDTMANAFQDAVDQRLLAPGAAGAVAAVHRSVLRHGGRGMGTALQRGRPEGRRRTVPAVVGRSARPSTRRWPGKTQDHPSALRRLVSEGRAGLQRALAAQQADRG